MKNKLIYLILSVLILASCNGTFVTKNVIDSRNFNFIHAGKSQNLLFELKEIKTFTRRNGIFTLHRDSGPVDRSTRFDFAIYASVSDGKTMNAIYEFPCQKGVDFDAFIDDLKVKHSKNRSHFAIGNKNEIVGVFSTFKKISFLSAFPLENLQTNQIDFSNFSKIDLNQLNNSREELLKHISGDKKMLISDKSLHDMLIQIPPNDELNYELSYSIVNETIFESQVYQKAIIKHCIKDKNWQKNALKSLKNKKDSLNIAPFISKLHAIGGMKEVVKEDEFQLKMFLSNGDLNYFLSRFDAQEIILSAKVKTGLKNDMLQKIKNPCKLSENQLNFFNDYFILLEKMKVKNGFDLFFENYQKSTCLNSTLHELTNEFLFPSATIGESDKRKWINFVVKNFKSIPAISRSWDFSTLEKDLSCEQKRELMTKFRKDIDVFENKEIPTCN